MINNFTFFVWTTWSKCVIYLRSYHHLSVSDVTRQKGIVNYFSFVLVHKNVRFWRHVWYFNKFIFSDENEEVFKKINYTKIFTLYCSNSTKIQTPWHRHFNTVTTKNSNQSRHLVIWPGIHIKLSSIWR